MTLDNDNYDDLVQDAPEPYNDEKKLYALIDSIRDGTVEKPDWVESYEQNATNYTDYPYESTMNVVAKAPEYEKLAELVVDYLYSTSHEATRDG